MLHVRPLLLTDARNRATDYRRQGLSSKESYIEICSRAFVRSAHEKWRSHGGRLDFESTGLCQEQLWTCRRLREYCCIPGTF